jgi:gamma-glutamylputrescine oxidase
MSLGSYYDFGIDSALQPAQLSGKYECRTCVIGGGFAGLNTALGLLERGDDSVLLLEAKQVGFGASGRNGGFIFGGFSMSPSVLLDAVGPVQAKRMYAGTQQAVELIRQRVYSFGVDCELVEQGVLWANWFRDPKILTQHQKLMSDVFDLPLEFISETSLRDRLNTNRYHGALLEPRAMHFHPLKFARGLAKIIEKKGGKIFEQTPAVAIEKNADEWIIRTPSAEVRAQRVVMACGGYLSGLRSKVDSAVLPIATYVMVTEPLGDKAKQAIATQAAVYDTRFAFDYYRMLPDTRLLWGGRISIRDRSPEEVKRLLYRDLLKVYPQLKDVSIDYAWSGLMSYARHEMPQIAEVEPGLWVAQAFGGHGVATTTLAGEVVASALMEGDQRYKDYASFGMTSTYKPFGFLGAQLSYWWLQSKDAWRSQIDG